MRLAVGVEYDGSGFFGWQRQRQSPTVQECLERALSRVADHEVTLHCAGRTDSGVHAWCQVAHFDTSSTRAERSWVLGANTYLMPGVSLLWARPVDETFHARFSARRRRYRYRIVNRWVRPAIERERATWIRRPLDAERMHTAAQGLVGEHDFSSFRAPGCQARSPVRTVHSVAVTRHGCEVTIDIEANAFLYHMVRNVAGVLIGIGEGRQPTTWLNEVLEARSRRAGGVTAPAQGLYFMAVEYPEHPHLPTDRRRAFPIHEEGGAV